MRKFTPLIVALLIALVGCEEPPPPPPEAPPEPTPAEIRTELSNSIQPLRQAAGPESTLLPTVKDEAVSAFHQVRSKHAGKENGQEALRMFASDVEQLISTARGNEAWMAAKGGIEIYKILNPGSDRYNALEQRADVMLARPTLRVSGFFGSGDATEIFVEVTDTQMDPPLKTYRVREGEEFHEKPTEHGLRPVVRVVRIIGNNSAVEFEYIPIQDTWTVQGPRQ